MKQETRKIKYNKTTKSKNLEEGGLLRSDEKKYLTEKQIKNLPMGLKIGIIKKKKAMEKK